MVSVAKSKCCQLSFSTSVNATFLAGMFIALLLPLGTGRLGIVLQLAKKSPANAVYKTGFKFHVLYFLN